MNVRIPTLVALSLLTGSTLASCNDTVPSEEEPWTFDDAVDDAEEQSSTAVGPESSDSSDAPPPPDDDPPDDPSGVAPPPDATECERPASSATISDVRVIDTASRVLRPIVVVDGGVVVDRWNEPEPYGPREYQHFFYADPHQEPTELRGSSGALIDGDRETVLFGTGSLLFATLGGTRGVLDAPLQWSPLTWSNRYRGESVRVLGDQVKAWPTGTGDVRADAPWVASDETLPMPISRGLPHVIAERVAYITHDGESGGIALWSFDGDEVIEAPDASVVELTTDFVWWTTHSGAVYRRALSGGQPEEVHAGPCGSVVASGDGSTVAFACDLLPPDGPGPWVPYDAIVVSDRDGVRQVIQDTPDAGIYMPVPDDGFVAYARYRPGTTQFDGGELRLLTPSGEVVPVAEIGRGCSECNSIRPPPYIDFEGGVLAFNYAVSESADRGVPVGFAVVGGLKDGRCELPEN